VKPAQLSAGARTHAGSAASSTVCNKSRILSGHSQLCCLRCVFPKGWVCVWCGFGISNRDEEERIQNAQKKKLVLVFEA